MMFRFAYPVVLLLLLFFMSCGIKNSEINSPGFDTFPVLQFNFQKTEVFFLFPAQITQSKKNV